MKILECESLAVDTFLSWLSKKLKSRTHKKIIGEERFIELTNTNPKKIIENKEISRKY